MLKAKPPPPAPLLPSSSPRGGRRGQTIVSACCLLLSLKPPPPSPLPHEWRGRRTTRSIGYLFLSLSLLLSLPLSAQPAWTLGAEKGVTWIDGEVRPGSGFAFGFFAERAIDPAFAVRLQLGMGDLLGLDRQPSFNWIRNPGWNGRIDAAADYRNAPNEFIYANHKTGYLEGSLQGVFTFTQLPQFRNNSPYDAFLLFGLGRMRYQVSVDALDGAGQVYDFALADTQLNPAVPDRTVVALSEVLDGNYETTIYDRPQYAATYQLGAGVRWRVGEQIALALTHRVALTDTDELDSYRWNAANFPDNRRDIHHYSNISVSYTFGRPPREVRPPPPPPVVRLPMRRIPLLVFPLRPLPALREIVVLPPPEPDTVIVKVELTEDEAEVVKRAFDNLEFATNKAIIRSVSFASLNELADLLAQQPDWRLTIQGHTDDVGAAEANLDLSRRRAEAVRDYLVARGIDPDRLLVSWYGETRPIAENTTPEGRQRNRRVEMEIVE